IQKTQRANARVESSLAALLVDVFLGVAGQRTNQFDLMDFEKLRQTFHAGLEEHREIAAIHHVSAESARRRDEISKIVMKLGRAAGDVQSRNPALREKTKHRVDVSATHLLLARWTRLDVAVNAGEITITPEIDLQNVHRAAAQMLIIGSE